MNINTLHIVQASGGTVGGTAAETSRGTIDVRYHDFATVYIDYVKGNEGTLYVYPKFQHTLGGTSYAWQGWGTAAEGDVIAAANRLKFTANASAYRTFDVRGHSYMELMSLPVGAATGALGLYVVLEGDE